ncbi:MAG: MBL fold metallo-hydrolase [Microthrixaceae bacterium]
MTFFGVRGSTPCSCESARRYGGNTSCVVVEQHGFPPILLDLGTGLRFFGVEGTHGHPFEATALVSHLHWDHVQGVPFFAPLLTDGSHLDFYGPRQEDLSLEQTVRGFLKPPYFPIGLDELPGRIDFHDLGADSFEVPGATVRSQWVPHVGPTLGYRIDCAEVSIAYVSDHQQPGTGSRQVDPGVIELCEGVDLLIHDAQYDEFEFSMRPDWGHCTVAYAVEVAARSGASQLALFHHDPSHSDERIDELTGEAVRLGDHLGVPEVIAAAEGLTISYEAAGSCELSAASRELAGRPPAGA